MDFLRNMARRYEEEEDVEREPTSQQGPSPFAQSPYRPHPQQALYAPFAPHLDPRYQLAAHQVHQAQTPLAAHFPNNVHRSSQDDNTPRSAHWQDYNQPQFRFPPQPVQLSQPHLQQLYAQQQLFYQQQALPYGLHVQSGPHFPAQAQRPQVAQVNPETTTGPRLYLHSGDAKRPNIVNPNPFDLAENRWRSRSKSSSVRGSSVAGRRRGRKSRYDGVVPFEDKHEGQAESHNGDPTPQMSPQTNNVSGSKKPMVRSSSPAAGGRSYEFEDEAQVSRARALIEANKATGNALQLAHPVPQRRAHLRSASSLKGGNINYSEISPVATSSPLPPKRVWPTVPSTSHTSVSTTVTAGSAARPSKIIKLKLPLVGTRIIGSSVPKNKRSRSKALMPPPPTPKQRDFVPPSDARSNSRKTLPKPQAAPEASMQNLQDKEHHQNHKYSTRSNLSKGGTSPIPAWALAAAPAAVVHPAGTVSPKDIHIRPTEPVITCGPVHFGPQVAVKDPVVKVVEPLIPKVAGYEHGSNIRGYMNQSLTPHLLDGMKWIARNQPPKPIHWLGAFLLRRSAVMEGTPSSALSFDNEEEEDEDPDADGEPDTEDHFSTHELPSPSQNEHRSWTPEPESQNQTLIAEHGHKSSYALDDSVVEAGELEHDGDVQMCEGQNDGEDELGHAALIDMSTSTERDSVNEAGLNGLGFGDEGILAEETGLGGYAQVW